MARQAADGLPMPYERARQLYPTEWYSYRRRQKWHHERFLECAAGWHRPTVATTEKVWALVSTASLSQIGIR